MDAVKNGGGTESETETEREHLKRQRLRRIASRHLPRREKKDGPPCIALHCMYVSLHTVRTCQLSRLELSDEALSLVFHSRKAEITVCSKQSSKPGVDQRSDRGVCVRNGLIYLWY